MHWHELSQLLCLEEYLCLHGGVVELFMDAIDSVPVIASLHRRHHLTSSIGKLEVKVLSFELQV